MENVETKIVRTQFGHDNSLNATASDPPPLPWKTNIKEARQRRKWETKLQKLRDELEEKADNLAMYEAQLADMPVPSAQAPTPRGNYEPSQWEQQIDLPLPPTWKQDPRYTAIVDAGASGLYFMPEAPVTNINEAEP